METKLRLAFRNPKLRLAHKAVLFAAFLWILRYGEFSFWSVAAFFAGALFLYAVPLFRTLEMAPVFSVFLIGAFAFLKYFSAPLHFFIGSIYATAVFYLILGVKELAFVNREDWRRLLALMIAYPIFLLFFYFPGDNLAAKIALLFLALLILTKSVLPARLPSWLVSLLVLEVAWAALFLPIGFVSQASLAALSYFTVLDLSYYAVEKRLTKKTIMTHATLFSLLALAIFAFSRWTL